MMDSLENAPCGEIKSGQLGLLRTLSIVRVSIAVVLLLVSIGVMFLVDEWYRALNSLLTAKLALKAISIDFGHVGKGNPIDFGQVEPYNYGMIIAAACGVAGGLGYFGLRIGSKCMIIAHFVMCLVASMGSFALNGYSIRHTLLYYNFDYLTKMDSEMLGDKSSALVKFPETFHTAQRVIIVAYSFCSLLGLALMISHVTSVIVMIFNWCGVQVYSGYAPVPTQPASDQSVGTSSLNQVMEVKTVEAQSLGNGQTNSIGLKKPKKPKVEGQEEQGSE